MSETPGVERLYSELASYGPTTLTVRVLQIVLGVLPDADPLPYYQTIDDAASSVFGGIPSDILQRAKEIAADGRVEQAMFAARSIDTGDTGLTIVSGVRSAVALFFGSKKGRSEAVAQQQRTDAALKALALAYLITRLVPIPAADRVELVRSIPAGQALIAYYGAVEIAVPFAERVLEANGTFVRDLVREQGRAMADKLLGIVGRQGVADAEAMLGTLAEELDRAALTAAPHTSALAEQIRAVLPSYVTGAGDLFDLVAAGADALPCYRYLCARLAVEAALALAKHERMPEVLLPETALTQPTVAVPEAPPLPPELLSSATGPLRLPAQHGLPDALGDAPTAPATQLASSPPVLSSSATIVASLDDLDLDEHDPAPSKPAPTAAASAPPPFDWPSAPLLEQNRLRGIFLSGRAGEPPSGSEQWRVFTVEGVYSERPAIVASGIDWNLLYQKGIRVATYRREGDSITMTDVSTARSPTSHTAIRSADQAVLTFDGQPHRRMDWDLTGRTLDGTWRTSTESLTLTASGQITRGARTGRYTLGIGAISIAWQDGTNESLTLLSDLKPSSRRPAYLWLDNRFWSLS